MGEGFAGELRQRCTLNSIYRSAAERTMAVEAAFFQIDSW